MDELGDRGEVRLEQPEGVRVGDHETTYVIAAFALEEAEYVLRMNQTVIALGDLDGLESSEGARCGVRAVCALGDEDLAWRASLGAVERTNEHHAGQLALCTGCRGEGTVIHAGDFAKPTREAPHDLEAALRISVGAERMQLEELGQARRPLIHLRVVFHRA